ncbi:MAG: CoA-binding protein [bacterium]|nr:CoA-binding protein [bacterium]MDE0351922.1 CoA-binding protein [bacterium]
MIVRGHERVLVQGITGRQATYWTARMQEYGTRVVAGVSPRKAGITHCGVPVFGSVLEAAEHVPLDVSVLFVPPLSVKPAALDAVAAGVPKLVILTEHVPVQDAMHVIAAAREAGTELVGPNTAGLVTPGESSVGFMPAFDPAIFRPGRVGVVSRSGSLGTLACLNIVRAGLGQSAFIGIGGDPVLGTRTRRALELLEQDRGTGAIVLIGEIGGDMEEDAAGYLPEMSKPVVAFVAGRASPPDRRMGHAGAIFQGDRGSYESKRRALEGAGAVVLDTPSGIGPALLAMEESDGIP